MQVFGQEINATSIEPTSTLWNVSIADMIVGMAAIAAIIISIWALRTQKRDSQRADRQHRNELLKLYFEMISSKEQKAARAKLYSIFTQYQKNNNLSIYTEGDNADSVEAVRIAFDSIAIFNHFDKSAQEELLTTFWSPPW